MAEGEFGERSTPDAQGVALRANPIKGNARSEDSPGGIGRGRNGALLLGLLVAIVCLIVILIASLAIGAKSIPFHTVVDSMLRYDSSNDGQIVVHTQRLPRTLLGLLVGMAIGLTGTMLQGLTRNPLSDPGIMGLNAGAALAAVIATVLFGSTSVGGYVWFAFIGVAIAGILVFTVASVGRGGATPVKVTIAGAAITALFASFTTMVLLRDVQTSLNTLRFWLVGSLAGRDLAVVRQALPYILLGSLFALLSGRALNTLSLGDDVARSLGQSVGRVRALVAVAIIVLTGAAVAVAGPIVFVGLVIPHMARLFTGPDYGWILAYSAVLAPILLILSDIIGRVVARPGELDVGLVTAFIGAPVFIAIVRRRKLADL